jgi:hypothetical protein
MSDKKQEPEYIIGSNYTIPQGQEYIIEPAFANRKTKQQTK